MAVEKREDGVVCEYSVVLRWLQRPKYRSATWCAQQGGRVSEQEHEAIVVKNLTGTTAWKMLYREETAAVVVVASKRDPQL